MYIKSLQAAMFRITILVLAGFALVLLPVAGTAEGHIIRTHTDIECIGTVKESSSYSNISSGSQEAYQSNFLAVNGTTRFVKDFQADSSSAPNLAADTLIGFTADPGGNLGVAVFEEKIGLSLVSAGGDGLDMAGILSLCPWAVGHGSGASCTAVAAGSKFKVTSIENFTSSARATSSEVPSLGYAVDAADRQGGFAGVGSITASMVVQIFESGEQWTDPGTPPPLQSSTIFSETSSADGIWNFSKQMEWGKRYGDLGSLNPFAELF